MTTIQQCLEVSTGNLAPAERDVVAHPTEGAGHLRIGPLSVYWYTDDVCARAHVLIGDENDRAWRDRYPTLAAAVDVAADRGATMLLVDIDVDPVDELAWYGD